MTPARTDPSPLTHTLPLLLAGSLLPIGLIPPLLESPLLLVSLLPMVGLTMGLAWLASNHGGVTLAAGGLAPLFIQDPLTALGAAGLLFLVLLSVAARSPLPLLLSIPLLVLDDPRAPLLLGLVIALLVAWPYPHDPARRGLLQRLHPAHIPLALVIALPTLLLYPLWWVPLAALTGGLAARYLDRHPANQQIARTTRQSAFFLSPLPAVLLFLLAALGRLEPASPLRAIATGWGTLGFGLLLVAVGIGIALLLVSRGPWSAIALATGTTLALTLLGTTLGTATLGLAPSAAAVAWPLLAPWAALAPAGAPRRLPAWIAWGLLLIAAAFAQGLRLLPHSV
jgi:hypothetical protein